MTTTSICFAPIQLFKTGLMQTHQDVSFLFRGDSRNEFVGAERPVCEKEVVRLDVLEEFGSHAGIMLLPTASFEASTSSLSA